MDSISNKCRVDGGSGSDADYVEIDPTGRYIRVHLTYSFPNNQSRQNHAIYLQIGIDPPRGVILHGPPGIGKTMLAKAVANHTTAAFTRVVGSEFVQKFWEDFITVGGLSVLPQVMWSTFVPFIPNSILPETLSFITANTAVIMARTGKLS